MIERKSLTEKYMPLALLGTLLVTQISAKTVAEHPKLILTPERLAALKISTTTTHEHLWKLAVQGAEEFSRGPIPEMADAHNRYRYIGDTMPVLGLAYLMTGEADYLESARAWLSALLSVPEWKGSSNLGRSSWVLGCALLYDWLYDALDEELRTRIRERLHSEALMIIDQPHDWRDLSNHFLIETAALGMVGLTFSGEVDEAEAFLTKADNWAKDIIEHAPQDGSWGEGVQYWLYGLSHFLKFLEAAKTTGYKNYYLEYDWLRKTGYFPIYFSLPGAPKEVMTLSDCRSDRYKPPFILFLLASVYENGHYQYYGNQLLLSEPHQYNWMDFIVYDPEITPESPENLPTLKHFSDNDFVSLRTSWQEDATAIGFRCGPAPGHRNQADPLRVEEGGFGPGHGHPDINSFCLFAHGEWLAVDPGYTHHKLTANHNTLLVNGHGQAGAGGEWMDYMEFEAREPAPAILRVESNRSYDYILGDAGNIYVDEAKLKTFRRHLLFLKPDIVVITDDLEGKTESLFEWLLNAREAITQVGENQYEIVRNEARLWVHPILPGDYHGSIKERESDASELDGKIVTLNLAVDSVAKTRFLVVLCALKNSVAQAPDVSYKDGTLKIKHGGKTWEVDVLKSAQVARPSDAVMIVKAPQPPMHQDYFFTRETD
ncbi:MAG: heparinase II/III family protein [Fidelibacterota bacterium]|nr:MAG: heparinase II/III family protein [Candidatus Neomarinimicrobiota bacterium]